MKFFKIPIILLFYCFLKISSYSQDKNISALFLKNEDTVNYNRILLHLKKNINNNDYENIKLTPHILRLNPKEKINIKNKYIMLSYAGISHKNLMKYDSAEHLQTLALNYFFTLNDSFQLARIYNALGVLEKNRGHYQDALNYYQKGLKYISFRNTFLIGQFYMNIGILYRNMKNKNKAIYYLNKSDSVFRFLKDTNNILRTLSNKVNTLKSFHDTNSCENIILEAYSLLKFPSSVASEIKYSTLIDYGWLKVIHREFKEVIPFLLDLEKKITDNKNNELLLDVYFLLFYSFAETENEEQFEIYKNKYLLIADSKKNFGEMVEGFEVIKKIYFKKRDYKKAFEFSEIINQNSARIYTDDLLKKMSDNEMQFKKVLANKTIELLHQKQKIQNLELKRQKTLIGLLMLLLLLSAFISIVIWKLYNKNKEYTIEIQKKSEIIKKQNNEISEKNKNLTETLKYTLALQKSTLSDIKNFFNFFSDHFVLMNNTNSLSNSFYYLDKKEEFVYLALAAGKGEGLSGAIHGVMNKNILDKIISTSNTPFTPAEILNLMNNELVMLLDGNSKEFVSMDVVVVRFNFNQNKILYSGTQLLMYLSQKNELINLSGNRKAFGKKSIMDNFVFTDIEIDINKNDMLYITGLKPDDFSDKNLTPEKLRNFISEIHRLNCAEQSKKIQEFMKDYINHPSLFNNVILIGIRI